MDLHLSNSNFGGALSLNLAAQTLSSDIGHPNATAAEHKEQNTKRNTVTSPGVAAPPLPRPTGHRRKPKGGRQRKARGRHKCPPPPPMQHEQSKGVKQEMHCRRNHMERLNQHTARGPHEVWAQQNRGGRGRAQREKEQTSTQRARTEYHEGNRTETAEHTQHMEWRTSRRGQGTSRRLKKVPTRTGPRCAPSACYPC